MKLRPLLYLPLALHVIPTVVVGYGVVLANGPVAGINDHSIGFAGTIIGTVVSYHAGIRLAQRRSEAGRPAAQR